MLLDGLYDQCSNCPHSGWQADFSAWTSIRQPDCLHPPVANAGPAQIIECAGISGASVTLDGSGSSDPDGYPMTYTWTWAGGSASGLNPTVQLPLGTTIVTLTVNDGKATSNATVNITVRDTVLPETVATGGSDNWNKTNVISSFTASDSCAGIKEIHYIIDGSETVVPGNYASITLSTEGNHNVSYYSADNAGNKEAPKSMTVKIDKSAPTGTITIDSGAPQTTSYLAPLTISAADTLSGVSQMRLSNDNLNWTTWEIYAPNISWTLTTGEGTKTVYVQFLDNAGNISSYSDSIIVDTTSPTITGISAPNRFRPRVGEVFTIAFSLSDNLSTSCNVKEEIFNSAGTLVRTIMKTNTICSVGGTSNSIAWDGRNDSGALVPSGLYNYKLTATDGAGNVSAVSTGSVRVR